MNAFLREIVGPAWACVRVIDQSEFLTTGSGENTLAIKRLNVVVGDDEVHVALPFLFQTDPPLTLIVHVDQKDADPGRRSGLVAGERPQSRHCCGPVRFSLQRQPAAD